MSSSISYSMTLPSLRPRLVDPLWLKLDEPRDENVELERFDKFHTPKAHMEVANMKVEPPIGVDPADRQGWYYMSRSNLRTHKRVHSDSGDGNENGEASSGDESDEEGSETSQDGSGGDADMGDDDDVQQR